MGFSLGGRYCHVIRAGQSAQPISGHGGSMRSRVDFARKKRGSPASIHRSGESQPSPAWWLGDPQRAFLSSSHLIPDTFRRLRRSHRAHSLFGVRIPDCTCPAALHCVLALSLRQDLIRRYPSRPTTVASSFRAPSVPLTSSAQRAFTPSTQPSASFIYKLHHGFATRIAGGQEPALGPRRSHSQ